MSDWCPVSSRSYPGAGRVMNREGDGERRYGGPQPDTGAEMSLPKDIYEETVKQVCYAIINLFQVYYCLNVSGELPGNS